MSVMRRIEPYNYYIGVYGECRYPPNELKKRYPEIFVAASVPRKNIYSYRQLIAAAQHFIGTLYLDRWIRNMDLRYLAFIFQESQIEKIIDNVEGEGDKILIIISRKEVDLDNICMALDIPDKSDRDLEIISKIAIFRLTVEKER